MSRIIRSAAPPDADRLAALSTALGYPMTPDEALRRLAEIADHPDHGLLVAAIDGRVEGWIQVSLPRIFETPRQAEIAGLIVDEGSRGAGIGRALVGAAESWARDKGCRAIRVRSNVVRERARAFYEREGFVVLKTQLDRYVPAPENLFSAASLYFAATQTWLDGGNPWTVTGTAGVDGVLARWVAPVSSSTRRRSVKVPPTSTPSR